MSIIYLLASFTFCYAAGRFILEKIGSKRICFSKIVVCGYFYMYAMQWFIGFPLQITHASWNTYYYIMMVLYFVQVIFLAYYWKKHIRWNDCYIINIIINHFQQYWVIYILVSIFSIMSMSSQFSYFKHSYDDYFYLGAVVQEIGNPTLSSVDFYTGMPEVSSFIRLLNTFSIQYSFMSVTFHIDPVAFARCAMVVQNYFIMFFAFHALFVELSKKEHGAQYKLALFALLLIPSAYLVDKKLMVSYDDWQLNNAIWYGSSIVRIVGLPVLLIFGKECAEHLTWKNSLWYGLLCVSFMSFSTIAFPFIILVSLITLIYFIWNQCQRYCPKKRNLYTGFLIVIIVGAIFVIPRLLYTLNSGFAEKMIDEMAGYEDNIIYYMSCSQVVRLLLPMMLIGALLIKKKTLSLFVIFTAALYVITFSGLFNSFIILISVFYDFVGLRFTTGVQLLIFALCSYMILYALEQQKKQLPVVATCGLTVFACAFNIKNLDYYKTLDFHTSGLSSDGFNVERLVHSDQMMPEIVVKVGEFFDTFPEKQRVLAPYTIDCEGSVLKFYDAIVYSSANASVLTRVGDSYVETDEYDDGVGRSQLISFIEEGEDVEGLNELLERYQIDFIFTTDPGLGDWYGWETYTTISYDDDSKELYVLQVS